MSDTGVGQEINSIDLTTLLQQLRLDELIAHTAWADPCPATASKPCAHSPAYQS